MQDFIHTTLEEMLLLTFSKLDILHQVSKSEIPKKAMPPIKISERLKRRAS